MARQPPPNPFYGTSSSTSNPSPTSPPPAYSRPVPPAPTPPPASAPVTYGSLSDLGKGRANTPTGYTYTPDATRQGYRSHTPVTESSAPAVPPRNMPPPPSNYGVNLPREPPRRTVGNERAAGATPPPAVPARPGGSRLQQAQTTAAGYIPNSVSATATSLGDKVKDGFDSIATQQRREQVVSGAGKVAAGAAKLAGKAAWSLGKFASGSK
ncbi:hypothetical protein DB88DRAFT_501051 [Papiliotrema laurentii]|uniref:Uncharacterized protein n=1 Tax=Papiliotrema laurentii TaxID=5418 RepID=A0AAD9FPR4_PAPLA|nr:hypothetical protein DB88DRAFT_501051 [Papiliotrema laurentii]